MLFIFLLPVTSLGQLGGEFAHYRLGIKYKKEKKYDKAIESFRKVLAVYPDNFNSYYQIAEMRIEQNKYGLGAYELKKALEYKPNWPDAQYLLSLCYENNKNYEKALIEWRKFTQISKDKKRNEEAEEHIKRLLALIRKEELKTAEVKTEKAKPKGIKTVSKAGFGDKIYSDPDYLKGLKLYRKKKYLKAIEFFRKAIKTYPGHPGAYYYAGIIRYERNEFGMAIINFTKGFPFKELGFNGHFYLGLIYEKQKRIDRAIREFRMYKRLTKSVAGKKEAQEHIDRLLAMKGKAPVARKIVETPPLPPKPFIYYIDDLLAFMIEDTTVGDGRIMMDAINLFKQGKFDKAIQKFKMVCLRSPLSNLADDAFYNVGICYMKMRLYDNAQTQFNQLKTDYPKSALLSKAEYLKGIAELEKDEFERAASVFRKWIRKYPKSELLPFAYSRLGEALVKQDLIKDGIEAFKQGLPFYGNDSLRLPVLYAIGENYQNIDNPSKAMEYYKKILDLGKKIGLSPYVKDAHLKLADYQYSLEKYDVAFNNYEIMAGAYPGAKDVPWAKYQMANIYRHKGLLDLAVESYKELIRNYPNDYWAKQAKWKVNDSVWQNEFKEMLQ